MAKRPGNKLHPARRAQAQRRPAAARRAHRLCAPRSATSGRKAAPGHHRRTSVPVAATTSARSKARHGCSAARRASLLRQRHPAVRKAAVKKPTRGAGSAKAERKPTPTAGAKKSTPAANRRSTAPRAAAASKATGKVATRGTRATTPAKQMGKPVCGQQRGGLPRHSSGSEGQLGTEGERLVCHSQGQGRRPAQLPWRQGVQPVPLPRQRPRGRDIGTAAGETRQPRPAGVPPHFCQHGPKSTKPSARRAAPEVEARSSGPSPPQPLKGQGGRLLSTRTSRPSAAPDKVPRSGAPPQSKARLRQRRKSPDAGTSSPVQSEPSAPTRAAAPTAAPSLKTGHGPHPRRVKETVGEGAKNASDTAALLSEGERAAKPMLRCPFRPRWLKPAPP